MIFPGLVSVTFRQLSPLEIVKLTAQAGLFGIEWGGDLHVPHGDLRQAQAVRDLTESAGLHVASYGSYYRTWPQEPAPFEQILETALVLGAPVIRVWAGKQPSAQSSQEHYNLIADEAHRIASLAAQNGVKVAFELHGNTLTDTDQSTIKLIEQVAHPALKSYWQPRVHDSLEANLSSIQTISPWLSNIHVFHWQVQRPDAILDRRPLREGVDRWKKYIKILEQLSENRYAMLEFVRDDSPEAFLEDAKTLREICTT